MHKLFPYHPVHVGQRTIKTAIASVLCAAVYLLAGRNPTFAVIGAIFGTGGDTEDSFRQGGNRFFGTLFGGILGMGLFWLYLQIYPDGAFRPLMLLFLAVGVVVLILVCQKFWPGGVQPGGVVLSILLFNTPVDEYLSYSINRIIDTGIGVLFALLVGLLLPRARMHRWMRKLHLKKIEENSTAVETIIIEVNNMEKYLCPCGYEYDPAVGDPDNGIAPGTAWEDVPEDWVCPVCGLGKEVFEQQ